MSLHKGAFVFRCLHDPLNYCPSCFRYISILPVIPVTVHVSPQEAVETRHPQDTRHPPPPIPKVSADLQTDLTLYKSVLPPEFKEQASLSAC